MLFRSNRHSRFEVAAPRHFLLPAILLLLAEEPRHGYSLAKGVHELQLGRVDRPSVYRALAQLEADGFIGSLPEVPMAGQNRRVYNLTAQGEQALRLWMGVIKQERDGLDRVLRRYVATGTVGWAIGGFGMGLLFNPTTVRLQTTESDDSELLGDVEPVTCTYLC